jgi:hypothetical protein
MKIFAMKDLFKTVYMVEPSSLQKYKSLSMFPWVLKILYGIVIDQKIMSKRSYYILVCGIIASVMNFIVAKGICDHAQSTVAIIFLSNVASAFVDVTLESLMIEQARKDP